MALGTTWWVADLSELDAAREVMARVAPDVVVHLAGAVTGSRELGAVADTLRGNVLATVNVLTAAVESGGPRVVLAGSMEEPGPDEPGVMPGHPYAASKVAATAYARMFEALYGLPVLILRVFIVYGPGETDERHLVPSVILGLLRGESPALGRGRRRIDWVYVDDVVDGLMTMVGPEAVSQFRDLPDRPLEHERAARVGPTQDALGWHVVTPLEEGLRRTVEWYRDRFGPRTPGPTP